MIFRAGIAVDLSNELPQFPFAPALRELMNVRFDRKKSAALLDQLRAGDSDPSLVCAQLDDERPILSEAALFPASQRWLFRIGAPRQVNGITSLDRESLGDFAAMLHRGLHTTDLAAFSADYELDPDYVIDEGAAAPTRRWRIAAAPGIYRHEHASLLIRSRTTALVLDPLSRLAGRLPGLLDLPLAPAQEVDAILITHGHGDHWHLPSLLGWAHDRATPVIVPAVERTNLLTLTDFASELRAFGQRALAPAWGATLRVGDIDIDVLPFHGEQPTREGPGAPAGVRNQGNCYRFNTPDFSALVLVDGGADPAGNLVDVVAESRRRRGDADVVLACLRSFASPFFGGLSHYWATVPFGQLAALHRQYEAGRLPPTTAGAAGLAEVCAAAGARHFLPYANGFEGLGRPIRDIGWGQGECSEAEATAELARGLRALGATTDVTAWNCGDHAHLRGGRLHIERWNEDALALS